MASDAQGALFERLGMVDVRGDVAIIGMACVFPEAPDLGAFWSNIVNRIDCVREASPARWDQKAFYRPDSRATGAIYNNRGGFLPDAIEFAAHEFEVMPSAAKAGNPDQFLALLCAQRAILDAGYSNRLHGISTEVVLGRGGYPSVREKATALRMSVSAQVLRVIETLRPDLDSAQLHALRAELLSAVPELCAESSVGALPNLASSRIANRFDLNGPSYTVDAACASSLIAVDVAVTDLLAGKIDLALAGGVHLFTNEDFLVGFSLMGALSRSGICRPFDSRGDGVVIAEGAGVLALKRLPEARRDGDRIYAIIKGVGVASDGRSTSHVAPKVEGEMLALQRAYARSGVPPDSVGLVEGHGTGTPLGDAVELEALTRFFGAKARGDSPVALGSVKSMMGHALPAAGAASLIKTALALHHKLLPPSLNCENPHALLREPQSSFYVNTETRAWIHGRDTPRRAGVSAFGFGGSNAHVVLEEDVEAEVAVCEATCSSGEWDSELVVLTADSHEELVDVVAGLARYTAACPSDASGPRLRDIAFSVNATGNDRARRVGIVASSVSNLNAQLVWLGDKLRTSESQPTSERGIYYFPTHHASNAAAKVAWLFPGMGSQYPHMLAGLCRHFPRVRGCFDALDRHSRAAGFEPPSGFIFPSLSPSTESSNSPGLPRELWDYAASSGAILQADVALLELMRALGMRADMVAGHSAGEWVAMVAAGMLDAETLTKLFLEVGRTFHAVTRSLPRRAVLAVGTRLDRVREILAAESVTAQIANDNCPHQVLINVAEADSAAVRQAFKRHAVLTDVMPLDKGYHSSELAPLSEVFLKHLQASGLANPNLPIYSCSTTQLISAGDTLALEAAARIVCTPVRFREMIDNMYRDGARLFVEIGPRSNLTAFVKDVLRGREHAAVALNSHRQSDLTSLHHALAHLAARHVNLDLTALYARRNPRKLSLSADDLPGARAASNGLKLSLVAPSLRVPEPLERRDLGATQSLRLNPASDETPHAVGAASKARTALLSEHFSTMTRLLETQEAVVGNYLRLRRVRVHGKGIGLAEQPGPAFPCEIMEYRPGATVVARRAISVASDPYLQDHLINGRYVVPLTMRMEMMAEVAQMLTPHRYLTKVADLSAVRWLSFARPQDHVAVRIVATIEQTRRDSGIVRTVMYDLGIEGAQVNAAHAIVAQASVLFATAYPMPTREIRSPPSVAPHACPISGESLYERGYLFHGPRMRGVQGVEHQDEHGLRARICVLPREDLIAGNKRPRFTADPIVIDSCGQLLGYWAQVFLSEQTILFPVRVKAIDLYQPPRMPPALLRCEMKLNEVQTQLASVDLAVFDEEGALSMTISQWTDWRFSSVRATGVRASSRPGAAQ